MRVDPSAFNDVTGKILAAAIEVHRTLGPGLLESVYLERLQLELAIHKLRFAVHRPVPIVYKGTQLHANYQIDLIVEDLVIVEVKSAVALVPVNVAQLLTYLRLTGCLVGLLVNFNTPRLMDGVKRVINAHPEIGTHPQG